MTPKRINLPFPHPGQQEVYRGLKRFNWLDCGRRWRKTTFAMSVAAERALQGQRIGWGAPTYKQVKIGWNEMYKAAADVAQFRITDSEVHFPNGGMVFYRSLDDPDSARGLSTDAWVLDEAGDISENAYYGVIQPMLIERQDTWLLAPGTPKGRNWFWREHIKANDRSDSAAWQIPTVGCAIVDNQLVRKPHPLENPHIPFEEIVRLYETMPQGLFKQEILAEFLEGEGIVFRNLKACMNAPLDVTPDAHKGHRIIMGVDWGKQNDFTAMSIGCATCKVELDRDRFNQIDYFVQRDRLKAKYQKWGAKGVLPERNSIGEPNIEALERDGFLLLRGEDGKSGFNTTGSTKPPLIENMALAFERAEWQFQEDPTWTAELEAYERVISPATGRSSYSAPEGLHDDTVMARALMLWGSRQNWIMAN